MDHSNDHAEAIDRAEQNRRNAQNSTGPTSPAGKNISKLNAVKTALTGRTVLLPTDNVAHYERHVQNWFADFNPQTPREEYLTQSIADTEWRLERIVQIESSLYAMGRVRFETDLRNDMADDVPDALLPALLNGHVYMFYEKQFRNLGIQETRLRRQLNQDLRRLEELQAERLAGKKTVEKEPETRTTANDDPSAGTAASRGSNNSSGGGFVFANEPLNPRKNNGPAIQSFGKRQTRRERRRGR